jgi:hypothetical protein
MALTRAFKQTVQARAARDQNFRLGLLKESIDCFLKDEIETGKLVLRDYINATVGFNRLGAATHHSPKSLMRMLGPHGNPQTQILFEVLKYLQKEEKVSLRVRAAAARR